MRASAGARAAALRRSMLGGGGGGGGGASGVGGVVPPGGALARLRGRIPPRGLMVCIYIQFSLFLVFFDCGAVLRS